MSSKIFSVFPVRVLQFHRKDETMVRRCAKVDTSVRGTIRTPHLAPFLSGIPREPFNSLGFTILTVLSPQKGL